MKKRMILFSLGMILLLSALPLSIKMIKEKIHTQEMYNRYEMDVLSNSYPPPTQKFTVLNHNVEIDETIIEEGNYTDLWDNDISIANLTIIVNGKKLATLENYPIRAKHEGIQKYHGNISFIVLFDKKEEERKLYVILRNTKDEIINENGVNIINLTSPLVDIKYTLHAIDEEGHIESETFSQNNRNAIQTHVLNSSGTSPMSVGYYTDAWHMYPSIFFPILFPLLTLLFGVILIIIYFPIRKVKE
ncbi:hypothetical protein ACIQ2D_21695 [Lysinibacillus sp. NPDC097287]|uniref:hypothetical protein n=1 Tax=Lysinibacillus sp. NPDC097287 TaxID=3364144 RepID=UPI0038098D8B